MTRLTELLEVQRERNSAAASPSLHGTKLWSVRTTKGETILPWLELLLGVTAHAPTTASGKEQGHCISKQQPLMCHPQMCSVLCCCCWADTEVTDNVSVDDPLFFPRIPPSDALKNTL